VEHLSETRGFGWFELLFRIGCDKRAKVVPVTISQIYEVIPTAPKKLLPRTVIHAL